MSHGPRVFKQNKNALTTLKKTTNKSLTFMYKIIFSPWTTDVFYYEIGKGCWGVGSGGFY